ncbi:MAG: hypothetical protein ABSD52_14570 [Candidatus Cybelea sp.]
MVKLIDDVPTELKAVVGMTVPAVRSTPETSTGAVPKTAEFVKVSVALVLDAVTLP